MPHEVELIMTLTGGLTAALIFGYLAQFLRLSPIVGYLLAGILVGPFTPGFVANKELAAQCAEIGVILLMFGVGLHFHLKDLLAVKHIAIPGAVAQILAATLLGAFLCKALNWSWTAGIVFGIAISVASTVVLTRVLSDNRALHSPSGHIAIGWLIVEDLFTILVLVLLPTLYRGESAEAAGPIWWTIGLALLKLVALIVFALVVGQKFIPKFLGFVARTGSRELFTLSILVLALGIAVGSAKFFGASMALGAFLAGMIVGQSDFSARAASDALPMRDAFAVLFFVSVGMLFDPGSLATGWPLMCGTLVIVLIGKPLAALIVVLILKRPVRSALTISIALAQIGEFSFILAAMAGDLQLLPQEAMNALVFASIVSITLSPLAYPLIEPVAAWLEKRGIGSKVGSILPGEPLVVDEAAHRIILVGYGPIGRTLFRILRDNGLAVTVIEMNLNTVEELKTKGVNAIYGDAAQHQILEHAGVGKSESLIITSNIPSVDIVKTAKELNPQIGIITRTGYLNEAGKLRKAGADAVFTSEGEIALSMLDYVMHRLGATDEQFDRESVRVRKELFEVVSE